MEALGDGLLIGNNFEDEIYVLGEFELFGLRAVVAMKNPLF